MAQQVLKICENIFYSRPAKPNDCRGILNLSRDIPGQLILKHYFYSEERLWANLF